MEEKVLFEENEIVTCVNDKPLEGNDIAPPIKEGEDYPIKGITLDKKGNQHLDLGLVSKYNYVRSHETGETLPNSGPGGIHWCHPSRVIKKVA